MKLIAYRGEHGPADQLLATRYGSLTFSSEEAARLYATQPNNSRDTPIDPRIIRAELVIENPLLNTPDDPFLDLAIVVNAFGLPAAKEIALRHADRIEETDHWASTYEASFTNLANLIALRPEALEDLYCLAFPLLDDPDFTKMMRWHGFDGAIHGGMSLTSDHPEYRVLDASQVNILNVDFLNERERATRRPRATMR